ncbi:MAG TPA: response regulator [Ramlibacter sp.]|jgi:CheY-like chemotaxis protein|uniref:response regulator transcription factor n=1 Tax=Ramlibacter sp. TaxID=1917967 RepID=UPI002D2BBE39|nr:response regulator [Ramlibacter sp.]HZY17797.1 response regulator [Ramlibacter sp.]
MPNGKKAPPGQRSGHGLASILEYVDFGLTQPSHLEHAFDRHAYRVLVVDDVAAQRYATERTLRAAGYVTLEAETGDDAIKLGASASAIILDVNLPDVHGIEVCTTLRASPATRSIPIVLTSAVYVDGVHKDAGLDALADAYLVPPVQAGELLDLVDRLIKKHSGAR